MLILGCKLPDGITMAISVEDVCPQSPEPRPSFAARFKDGLREGSSPKKMKQMKNMRIQARYLRIFLSMGNMDERRIIIDYQLIVPCITEYRRVVTMILSVCNVIRPGNMVRK